jgi:PAS domain S-box-containing protein
VDAVRALLAGARAAFAACAKGAPMRAALAVLVAAQLLTAAEVVHTWRKARLREQARLSLAADRLEGSLARRLHRAEQLLHAAAAADAAARGFDHASFRTYVLSLSASGQLQPAPRLGWVERVQRERLPAYLARQAAWSPGFSIDTSGNAPDLLVVTYLERRQGDTGFGRDMGADPLRRTAIERAIATGTLTWTQPVHIVAEHGAIGWLAFLPVYRAGAPVATVTQRQQALRGLLFVPMPAREVLGSGSGAQEDGLQFQVRDGSASDAMEVFDSRTLSPSGPADADTALPMQERHVDAGGRRLSVRIWSEAPSRANAAAVTAGFIGVILSLLLALASANVLHARERARARSRQMHRELRRMTDLAEHSSGVLVGLDARLRVSWVNAGFTHLTGWDDAHCRDLPIQRLLRAADGRDELPQAADRLRFGAPRIRRELLASRRDGGVCWLDADLQPEADGFVLTAIDITGRREAEQRLAENEHLMRLMMDSIEARVSYWDTDLRCRVANRMVARTVGRRGSQLLGMRMADMLGPQRWAQLEPRALRALAGEPQRFEWTTPGPDGTDIVTLLHYRPDIDQGHVRGIFAFAVDITELKEAQRAALRANEAKSQFLSHMSHEIRTPINGLLGMLALLRGTALGPRQSEYAGKAETAARSLLGLLNDVLDLSKIEAGRMLLDLAPFRPALLLRDLAAILDGAGRPRGLQLDFVLDPAIPPVLVGDDMRLRQVLVNLGGNAVKFTREGEVSIGIRLLARDGDQVRLEFAVRDTGIGIAPADQERIFSDFSQASAATTREFGGTGLGLGICRRLVAMMGGELSLDSAPGRGSRFSFELSLAVADEAAVPVTAAAPQLGTGDALAGLRLLVVEDNPVNQQVARELLAAQGPQATVPTTGAHGVHCVETASPPFDAVLMDVQMPVMDGWAAAREIRTRLGDTTTPIIAMTANAMSADRERSLQAGMDHHVAKPFDLPGLVQLLRKVTGRSAVAPSPSAPAAPAWCRSTALERMGGQHALLERMVPVFRDNLWRSAGALESLRGDTPPQQAIALFHTLKGMAATMGAQALAESASRAERDVKDGARDPAGAAREVSAALAGTLDALDAG